MNLCISVLNLNDFTDEDDVFAQSDGRCENPVFATVSDSQPLSQLYGTHREVAHGDVGAVDAFQCFSQLLLVGGGDAEDVQLSSGEVGQLGVGHEEMAVGGKSADGKTL